jgi:probable phosphoglycerate mutase
MHIFFIRHGETTGDVEDRYGGAYDDHLTEHGFAQSEALANSLKGAHLQALYVSPMARARETADILSRAFGCTTTRVQDFRERNQYGILSGMPKAEAARAHPDMVEALKDRLNTIEGAESYEALRDRVRVALIETIERAEGRKEERIGIVWHGGPMRVLFRDVLKWGELARVSDCCFVELEHAQSTWAYCTSEGLEFDFALT